MHNPILKSKNYLIAYIMVWTVVAAVQATFLYYELNLPLEIAVLDSVVFNVFFGFLGLVSWYTIRFSELQPVSSLSFWINHLVGGVTIIAIWFYSSQFVISLVNEEYIQGNIYQSIVPIRFIAGFLFMSIILLIYYLIMNYSGLQEKKLAETELKTLVREAELEALKSQVNPHFLFNSLNSISSLTLLDVNKAQEMIIKLSEFLRYSLKYSKSDQTTLEEEIKNVNLYLEIEKIRFGAKLKYEIIGEETCKTCRIPNMILQPLYENAIKYGVQESSGEVTIKTEIKKKDNSLIISIQNNHELNTPSRKGRGLGLKNISGRLALIYERDDLVIINKAEKLFEVKVKIPQKNIS